MLKRLRTVVVTSVLTVPLAIGVGRASETEELAPFKMIRSLQYVQDSVVLGDHSAIEMQRFILGEIGERLRAADPAVFRDPRNVDAALVHVMSGGNPETLDYLTDRDVEGNFDSRVTDALRQYLRGKGPLIVENLSKAAPEYKNSRIGPYLFLILGNATSQQDPLAAMRYYDWARLTAPGSIIEEAALRRSVSLAARAGDPDRGFRYALTYARRYLTSPYASQFADVFVELAVDHFDEAAAQKVSEILAFMDPPRRREVYLRAARRAAIAGNQRPNVPMSWPAAAARKRRCLRAFTRGLLPFLPMTCLRRHRRSQRFPRKNYRRATVLCGRRPERLSMQSFDHHRM
jgi:chemotaxis protein MotC